MNRERVISILNEGGLSAQKKFGQNFLCADEVVSHILEVAGVGECSGDAGSGASVDPVASVSSVASVSADAGVRILEIGPGIGGITEALLASGAFVTAVEIDRGLASYLSSSLFADNPRGKLICADFLKLDDYGAPYDLVLSNIPYYVMTPIMRKLLVECSSASSMTFMIEEEAFARIAAPVGSKQYGPLAVLCSLYGIVRKEFVVPASCFYPAPHTTSCVITLKADRRYEVTPELAGFVDAAFSMRRKTLINCLSSSYSSDAVRGTLTSLGIDPSVRAEALTPSELYDLYVLLNG